MSELIEAAEKGDLPAVRARLAAGDNVNAANQDGYTALHRASHNGHLDVVRELLKAGANVHAVNQVGNTAPHVASMWGHLDAVRELLRAGADLTLKNNKGKTPRDVATNNEMRHLLEEAERAWQAKQQAIASLMRNRLDRDCFRAIPLQIRLEMRTFVLCLTHLRWRVPRDVQHLIFLQVVRSCPPFVEKKEETVVCRVRFHIQEPWCNVEMMKHAAQ